MSESFAYHPEVLDRHWYERFVELNFSDFDKLDGDGSERVKQKEAFLAGDIVTPSLDYPHLEEFDFQEREASLLELKAEIVDTEQNEIVKKIYRTRINEAVAKLRMLKAARDHDDRRFSAYSDYIYGAPEGDLVSYTASFVQKKIDRFLHSKHKEKRDAALLLQDMTGTHEISDIQPPTAEGENLTGSIKNVDEVVQLFEQYLEDEGVDDWDVVVSDNESISGFRVSQERKEMVIPGTQFTGEKGKTQGVVHGFLHHEGMHVKRRHSGERSKLALLGVGLDRVEKGEEGVATYTEQQVRGTKEYAHPQRYFAIAYAKGEIDGKPKDFRQTFEMLKQYYLMSLKPGEDLAVRADDWAWKLTVRVFRGTTGKTPGAVYTKDMAYFQGNKETWELVSKDSEITKKFSIGKFDTYNERHISMLVELGILDEDLRLLESD
ncbi:MAG: tyrosine/phenylalanine carboxypeptidase domain-containing protein [Patescibacteria group bacterium]